MKKIVCICLSLLIGLSVILLPNNNFTNNIQANAATGISLADLKSRFPENKYWNHYCSKESDTSNYCRDKGLNCYEDSVSDSPCWSHSTSGYSAYVGHYDCNRFNGGTQCCGFAQKIAYIAYGSYCSAWSRGSLSTLKPGDVIHYYGDGAGSEWGHWVMVIAVNGSSITVGECNWGARCRINWTRTANTNNMSNVTVYSAPWTLPSSGSTPSVTLTVDTRYPTPFKCRIISTTKVQCYNDAAKTSSPGYIYPDDDCVVNAIYTNGLLKCDCPWNDGTTKTVYIDKTAFINSSMTPASLSAPQYAVTYLRSDGGTSIGWIDPGDSITKVATSGSYTQIIYPASSGKRCAWVATSALSTPSTVNYPTPFYCRTISTSKVACYNDVNFSSSPGYIYPDDDCTITALYSNGKVQCLCPWSDGSTKTVYVNSSVFFPSTPTPVAMTAPKKANTYLRTTSTDSVWGWIDAGDAIYKLSSSGNLTQVLYPTSSGKYRCAWAYSADLTQSYTVSYNANGGTGAPGNQTKEYNVNLTLSSTQPTRTGYTFLGWSTSSSATSAQYASGGVYTANANVTLYAVWKVNQYNISFDANGGTGAPSPQTKTYGVTLTLSSTRPTRTGYTFLGWSTNKTATSATYAAGGSYTANSAATLYAVWKINTYTVSYDANGGTGAPSSQTKTYGVALVLSAEVPTRTGYTFLGWTSNKAIEAVEYEKGDFYYFDSSVTLYAVWQINTYTISYDANGGKGAPSSQTKTHDVALTLSSTEPVRAGYTFLGWSTNKDATSADYIAGGSYSANSDATLYAVWEANTYTVGYDANGGTGAPSAQTKTHDVALTLSSVKPTRTGYTFLGWSADKTATSATYAAGDSYTENTSVTLYAVWQQDTPEYISGDINGDGTVNNKDLTRLMKYLAGENVNVVEEALDVNGDGTVNNKDLTRLMKYLAGEDVSIY